MVFDIHWTITVNVPQLETLREQLMADLQGIRDAIVTLTAQQAAGSDAIAQQLTTIADEISQLNAESIEQADLDALAQQVRDAAAVAEQQASQIRANSAQIAGMVPDEAPPTPPA